MYVVIVTEKYGKIELTREELQKMLDDAYARGKEEGKTYTYPYPITFPSIPSDPITKPSITWTCADKDVTL